MILPLSVLNVPSIASNLGFIRTNCKVSQEQQQEQQQQQQQLTNS